MSLKLSCGTFSKILTVSSAKFWSLHIKSSAPSISSFKKFSSDARSSMSDPPGHNRAKCVFCRIADGGEKNEIVYENDDYVVFSDIKPATPHHYLIIPRKHFASVKSLSFANSDMISSMVGIGQKVLGERAGTSEDSRFGFHWPPLTSINHLHLHAIGLQSQMGAIANLIFRPNSFWFVSPDVALQWLKDNKS